ncbi:MAG: GNAT family N-acetyltransferase [Actinomycetota bacterium]
MRIRPAKEDDLLSLARIFARAATYLMERYRPEQIGHFPVDPESRLPTYRHLVRTGAVFVAEDPAPAGFAAAVIRDQVWFLSQFWVLPERHASGIGTSLLDHALAWGAGSRALTVVSSPHPAAQLMYLRASMFPLWVQHDLTLAEADQPPMPAGFDDLNDDDQRWIDDLDREVRGVARPQDHAFWRGLGTGVALRRHGSPAGYVYVQPGGKIGPGAVRDPGDTVTLLQAARHLAGGAATVAVPSTNWSALHALVGAGFSPMGSNTFLASRPLPDASRYLSSGGALA